MGFEDVFDLVKNPDKEKYRLLLIYIDKILNNLVNKSNEITYVNIHLEGISEPCLLILQEFIAAKFFHLALLLEGESDFIKKKITELDRILRFRYREVPSYVSGLKTNKKAKKWREGKVIAEKLLHFYQNILAKYGERASFSPRTLMNILSRDRAILQEKLEIQPLAIVIENRKTDVAPVLLNSELVWDEIDGMKLSEEEYLFDEIENIVIIGSEGKKFSRTFTHRELKEWSQSGKLKNILVLSASREKDGFAKLKSRLERIQANYHSTPKYPDYLAYPILKEEVDHLLKVRASSIREVDFFGEEQSYLWDQFISLTKLYEGLYELRSYKLMNIYSVVTDNEVKEIVLDGIFGQSHQLLTDETHRNLQELLPETVGKIRTALDLVLTYIANSGWREHLLGKFSIESVLVLSEAVMGHSILLNAFKNSLQLNNRQRIRSWFSLDPAHEKGKIIVLDYRDPGRFPYTIRPNIFELPTNGSIIECYFIKVFFKHKFDWSRYRYSLDLLRILTNELRIRYFGIDKLYLEIGKEKPQVVESTNWDIENQIDTSRPVITFKIRFDSNRVRSFAPSELIIVRLGSTSNLFVARLAEIVEEDYDESIYLQVLDEIHSQFNIYEKIANKDREARELKLIKENYSLDANERAERLWKLLLKRKATEKGLDTLYSEVQVYLKNHNADLVSMSTFESQWLDVESTTLIPREKKSFYFLCEYLGLPPAYFAIMVRLKNVGVQNSRQNSKQMDSLLSDLINAGCFDDDEKEIEKTLNDLKDQLQRDHDLKEIGFYSDTLVEDLKALIELLKPHIQLTKIKDIQIN